MEKNITYYTENAEDLAAQYDRVQFESVHSTWINEIPEDGMALDIGAGSGRDARFLSSCGLSVIAVEPSDGIREVAQRYDAGEHIHWLADSLPELKKVFGLQVKFDLILLSAVWMHIPPGKRLTCMRKLSSLLKPNGKLIISLRHGQCCDERTMYAVSASELAQLANKFGLTYQLLTERDQSDELGRDEVTWQTVMLQLPDDGTGAFPLLRNIVVNDSKSSTYKIALLRTLLRIAEGHPGAVIEQTEDHVALPMGLVALYWLKLYKPLLDQYEMQQSSNSSRGLGFVKSDGWEKLRPFASNDFYIGGVYSQHATDLYKTLKDISSTIKNMPAKYITLPNADKALFHVELNRTNKPKTSLNLNFEFLSSIGKFYVPQHIWNSLTRFSVWIEPALVNEWATLMDSFGRNKTSAFTKLDYFNALRWEDPARSTYRVRKRVEQLLKAQRVVCCWSGRPIVSSCYAVDHAFPFARWPNNDLWNLLPTKTAVNTKKSDKLPTKDAIANSRELITSWWYQGWHNNIDEFFTQASFALPNLPPSNRSFDDVFEAFSLQRERIKDFQQLAEWNK